MFFSVFWQCWHYRCMSESICYFGLECCLYLQQIYHFLKVNRLGFLVSVLKKAGPEFPEQWGE